MDEFESKPTSEIFREGFIFGFGFWLAAFVMSLVGAMFYLNIAEALR